MAKNNAALERMREIVVRVKPNIFQFVFADFEFTFQYKKDIEKKRFTEQHSWKLTASFDRMYRY